MDPNNMSMDDEELDAEIGCMNDRIDESLGDPEAQ